MTEATVSNYDMAIRSTANPILLPGDLRPSGEGMEIACLLNPGAFVFEGVSYLLLRVAERPLPIEGRVLIATAGKDGGIEVLDVAGDDPQLNATDPRVIRYAGQDYTTTLSYLRLVSSSDGVRFTEPEWATPIMGASDLETMGIEDCRVTQIGNVFYLTFTQVSHNGVGVGMRSTSDWRRFKDHGMILPPHNKDCAVFTEKIGDRYFALHRPSSPEIGGNYIWIAESPDLVHWGNHRCVAQTRSGYWDCARVGAGAAPIKTTSGWLEIYHGATSAHRYCLGLLLLDLAEPWKVVARSEAPIMEPDAPYELKGFLGEVIFTNGHILNGDRLTVYYGAADSVICSAEFSVRELLFSLGFEGSAA